MRSPARRGADAAAGAEHAEHAHRRATIGGGPRGCVRTPTPRAWTCSATPANAWSCSAALRAAGAQPVSEAAGEIVRVEHGRPRYGVDLDDSVIPQEAGLNERAVSFTKGCYVGQETVARLYYRGRPNRHLRGLRLSEPLAGGEQLRVAERAVGRVSSAVSSPARGPIALALVRREVEPGARVTAGEQGATATVVELPFASAA